MTQSFPRISVIIPVFNGARTLPKVLVALTETNPAPAEVIVVDDGSTDNSARLATEFECQVIRLEQNVGAAAETKRGAQKATGDILFFTDADVVVPRETFGLLAAAFAREAWESEETLEGYLSQDVVGVVGLLDPQIPYTNFASQYKNLWMYFTYSQFTAPSKDSIVVPANRSAVSADAQTPQAIGLFYTSAAAMKRGTFLELGGFDENYRGASIAEDTEFGQRAWARGAKIILAPELRVRHLKRYDALGLLREDLRRARALTLLRLRKRGAPFFTSVPLFYQLAVPVIYAALVVLVLGLSVGVRNLDFATCSCALGFLALFVFYGLNSPWLSFLGRERGILFLLQAALFLPIDVIVVGFGIIAALFDFARGKKY